jgi:hypothetical protein
LRRDVDDASAAGEDTDEVDEEDVELIEIPSDDGSDTVAIGVIVKDDTLTGEFFLKDEFPGQ